MVVQQVSSPMRSVFISHGAPNLPLHETPARFFLEQLTTYVQKPSAIIVVSAHFETDGPVVVTDPQPDMIYDFRGFEPELQEIVYAAPGEPGLAARVYDALSNAGLKPRQVEKRGFDHGVWVPLMLAFPEADVPIVQVSIDPSKGADYHYQLGEALRPALDDQTLVVGTGALTHNLGLLFDPNGRRRNRLDPGEDWVEAFGDWIDDQVTTGNTGALIDFEAQAPFARKNHPEAEHLMPLFVAMGAAGGVAGQQLHKSTEYAVLRMDTYGFPAN